MPDNKAVVKTGNEKSISPAVIKRLPRYYRYLGDLLKNDVVRISSKELSQRMNVTASQIRQDLNNFGGFGQQGYGYNVEYLYNEMGKILVDEDVLAKYAGSAAVECAGVVGMASVNMKDGIVKLLKKESIRHGVYVIVKDNKLYIELRIIVAYGVSIMTVAENLVESVKYKIEEFTGMDVGKIIVRVEDVKVVD